MVKVAPKDRVCVKRYLLVKEFMKKNPKVSITDSCKRLKIHQSDFYAGRHIMEPGKSVDGVGSYRKVKMKAPAQPVPESRMMLVMGTPDQIRQAIGGVL